MKKLLLLAFIGAMVFTACSDNNKTPNLEAIRVRDSLNNIIQKNKVEYDSTLAILNDVEEGFRQINEAEHRVDLAQNGEGRNRRQVIRENIKFIAERMDKNRKLIAQLNKRLGSSSHKSKQLQKTLENLNKQLEEKNEQLQKMREELDAKDIHIAQLDETVNNLISTAGDLSSDNARKNETISQQDLQLNTAWYAFGTKKELKTQGIYEHKKVLNGNFNRGYFTKIDIRRTREIKLYSKKAKLLTAHPSSSYQLTKDNTEQYTLRITNPQLFWSTSKYLVVLVK